MNNYNNPRFGPLKLALEELFSPFAVPQEIINLVDGLPAHLPSQIIGKLAAAVMQMASKHKRCIEKMHGLLTDLLASDKKPPPALPPPKLQPKAASPVAGSKLKK